MFEVGVVAQFDAAHRLRGDFGPATRLHGHTYRVEVSVRGPVLRPDETLYDIGLLQRAVNDVVAALDYRDLDELTLFSGRVTTAEVVAQVVAESVRSGIDGAGLSLLLVRVWESPQAYAAYELELGTNSA